jgi:D-sedoheptulose 7-phosphate isomerase
VSAGAGSTGETRRQLNALSDLARVCAADLAEPVAQLADLVLTTLRSGGKLLFCGNGGSAGDAQHIAAEYVVRFVKDRRALPALALTTNPSVLTAEGNDHGFETVFARQVDALGAPGDLLICHSSSGESENLVRAAEMARSRGLRTVALLAKGGGRLREGVDLAIIVPTEETARAQEIHLVMEHIVCALVDRAIMESDG